MQGNKRGRPTKYSPERLSRLTTALSAGNTRKDSCAYAGISEDTLQYWMKTRPGFAEEVTEAEAGAAVRNVAIVSWAANNGVWQAAAWWLERRRKADWAQRTEHTGADAGPVKVIVEYTKSQF